MERQLAILSQNTHRLLRATLGAGLFLLLAFTSAPTPVVPRCDLQRLNDAYLTLLNVERRKVNAAAPTAYFDKVLLVGTIRHNDRMQTLDSLFHDTDSPVAELVGTLLDGDPIAPDKLARLIFRRLKASEGHRVIQESPERTFISLAVSQDFYTVRLARVPGGCGQSQRPRPHRSR